MGCFHPACFGHWKKQRTETKHHVQGQPVCSGEVVTASSTESIKQEEIEIGVSLVDPVSQTQAKGGDHLMDVKKANGSNVDGLNATDTIENGRGDNQMGKGKEEESHAPQPAADDGPENVLMIEKKICSPVAANSSRDIIISKFDDNNNPKAGDIWDCCPVQSESSDSLFSLSIDSRKHHRVSAPELGDEKEVSSPLKKMIPSHTERERTMGKSLVDSVPLATATGDEEDNENLVLVAKCTKLDESTLETSLSSWLVGSAHNYTRKESSPESEKNYRDRQILRAITPAELELLKGHLSAASEPCHSADDMPGVGTVGRFWQQTGLISR